MLFISQHDNGSVDGYSYSALFFVDINHPSTRYRREKKFKAPPSGDIMTSFAVCKNLSSSAKRSVTERDGGRVILSNTRKESGMPLQRTSFETLYGALFRKYKLMTPFLVCQTTSLCWNGVHYRKLCCWTLSRGRPLSILITAILSAVIAMKSSPTWKKT